MKSGTKSRQEEYISRLNELYSVVEAWVEYANVRASRGVKKQPDICSPLPNLRASRGVIELHEEAIGRYEAPTLTIQDSGGSKVADLVPVGAWIIGAEGRVDLVGSLGRESLMYMAEGGPQFTTKATNSGKAKAEHSTPLFRGVEQAGWYWIERWRPSRARRLEEELFMDLLSEVSDYDVR